MLASKYRLSKKTDFDRVFKMGRRVMSPYFGLRYLKNDLEHSRISVVVSNKVSKKAVERNRLKRQVRSIIEQSLPNFKAHYDLIINVMSQALNQDYQVLNQALLKLLTKNKII